MTFKNRTTKATTTKKYRCYVLAEKTEEEEVKDLTMTAEATGVKQITVTFNQAVDTTVSDTITVKKGSSTSNVTAITPSSDAASAVITMGSKLTAGTYTVSVTSGETTLTADITVTDETMTSFALVNSKLIASATSGSAATISFKALNQYGEAMAASSISATCSFGTTSVKTTPSAERNGKVTVTEIPSTLAIEGTTGTIVLVNTENGVTLTAEITYCSKAVASSATVAGIYYTTTQDLLEGNLTVGTVAANYAILVNIKDQYDEDMGVSDIADSGSDVSLNPAPVLTDLTVDSSALKINSENESNFTDVTYDGGSYIAIPLYSSGTNGKITASGTLSLTMVSAYKGVLATPSFTVDDAILIESFSVSANDTVYDNQWNTLTVSAVDTDGNEVTAYDDLKTAFQSTLDNYSDTTGGIILYKNADGTGTFYYNPINVVSGTTGGTSSSLGTVTFFANPTNSGKYIVKTVSFTVYQTRVATSVSGVTGFTAVAAVSGSALNIYTYNVAIDDQYSSSYSTASSYGSNVYAYIDDSSRGIFQDSSEVNSVFTFNAQPTLTASGTIGTATLYLKYSTTSLTADKVKADPDCKVTLSAVDVSALSASDMTLTVNNGATIYASGAVTLVPDYYTYSQSAKTVSSAAVYVTANVGGKTVVIPESMLTVTSGTVGGYGYLSDDEAANNGGSSTTTTTTATSTVTVVVDSSLGVQKLTADVTASNAYSYVSSIWDNGDVDATTDGTATSVSATDLLASIGISDQYGLTITDSVASSVIYTITPVGVRADDLVVYKNATQNAYIVIDSTEVSSAYSSGYNAFITVECGGVTNYFTQYIKGLSL